LLAFPQEVLERLQGCAGPDEMREVLGERQRELEEALKELEYRLQEKDAQLDEVRACLPACVPACLVLRWLLIYECVASIRFVFRLNSTS